MRTVFVGAFAVGLIAMLWAPLRSATRDLVTLRDDLAAYQVAHDAEVAALRDEVARLRADLDAKPLVITAPAPVRQEEHDPHRHEQRLGNLEYDRYGLRP